MPEIFFEAFELVAPEAASSVLPAVAPEVIGTAAGANAGANFLGNMSAVNAIENPAIAQEMTQAGITGGGGAGASGINEELIRQQQAKAMEIANSGIDRAMTPAQEAYLRSSTASVDKALPNSVMQYSNPYIYQSSPNIMSMETAPSSNALSRGIMGNSPVNVPTDLVANTNIPSVPTEVANANLPQPGSVLDNGGMTPPPSAFDRGWIKATDFIEKNPFTSAGIAYMGASKLGLLDPKRTNFSNEPYNGPLSRYRMSPDFQPRFANPTQFQYTPRYAEGGIMSYAAGGPVEQMSNNAAIGANTMYPMANMTTSAFATPYQDPKSTNMMASMAPAGGGTVDQMSGEPNMQGTRLAEGGIAHYDLGGEIGGAINSIGTGIGNAVHGAGNVLNNALDGRISMANPQYTGLDQISKLMGQQTADQVAKKYSNTTLSQNGVNPQQYQYAPQYAQGGVAHFAKGNLADSLNYYNSMIGGTADEQMAKMRTPTGGQGDAGIFRDTDPDTAYLSAPEAAAVRMAKVNAKANMQGLTLPRPKPIGRINLKPQGVKQAEASGSSLDPEMAASGGIMGANLGGYAAGGNPRLLKGPGDGMSDDIPATIANRQPARLADGEFVVPADVVSHLGNGSTEAGAKKLHHMMDSVRKARTGNSKQGKQINPNKFLPK
jgi:hypothetical protein